MDFLTNLFYVGLVLGLIPAILCFIFLAYLLSQQKRELTEKEQIAQQKNLFTNSLLENFEYPNLVQQIVKSVCKYLHFEMAILLLVDQEDLNSTDGKNIKTAAMSLPSEDQIKPATKLSLEQLTFSTFDLNHPLILSYSQQKIIQADKLSQLTSPLLAKEQADMIQEELDIKSFLVIPVHNGQNLGLLLVGSKKSFDEIPAIIKENIYSTSQRIGLLIDHSMNYSSLLLSKESLSGMTQQIYQMNAKLHQLDKLKDDFVSVASHELRTPMTAIRSYVWMALHKADITLSEKMTRYLTRTLLSTERLINLVNDMLNVSRIESGRIEISPRAFDLATLIKDCVAEVGPKAAEKKLHINVVESELPAVFADPDKIHQVALNLIGNALKFTPHEGTITVSFFSDGNNIETHVKDSGVGITKEDLSHLFKKFGRLDNSYVAAATSGGTGLGLYISKSLVDLMKGKIWATSEGAGKGTTFIFSLPIATKENLVEAEKFAVKSQGEAKALEPVAL